MVPSNISQVGFLKSQVSLSGLARLLRPLDQQFAIGGRVQDLSIPKPIYSVLFAKGKVKKAKTHRAAFRRRGKLCVTTEASHVEEAHLVDQKYVDHLDRVISCLRVVLQGLDSEIEEIYSTLQLGLASGADSQQPSDQQDNMVALNPQVHAEFDRFGLLLNPIGQASWTWVNERRKLPVSLLL